MEGQEVNTHPLKGSKKNNIIMKNLFMLLLLCMSMAAGATNYYIDFTAGNDANTGTSAAFAWKTLVKVNSASLSSGDVLYFKRGESWYGSITRSLSNITIDAYGTGQLPVISGVKILSSWVATGGNKYYSSLITDSTLNMVTLDGVPQTIARYPNAGDANGGYLTYNSVSSATTTKIRSTVSGNWNGFKGWMKTNDWRLTKFIVTADNNDTLTFQKWFDFTLGGTSGLEAVKSGYGYTFMDDTTFLDQNGEWTYKKSLNRVYMYFSDNNPAAHTIKAATVDTLINMGSSVNVTVRNIHFEYGNMYGIYGSQASTVTVTDCLFNNMGGEAMGFYRLSNSTIARNVLNDCLQSGIYVQSPTTPYPNVLIEDNVLTDIGILPGMGSFNQGNDYTGIGATVANGLIVRRNFVSNVGIDGIRWNGGNVEIANNWVEWFCSVGQDHAAYYTYTDPATTSYYRNRRLHHNFAMNGIGSPQGTLGGTRRASGIYDDGASGFILHDSNVVAYVPRSGFNLNIDSNITVTDNLVVMSDSSTHTGARGLGIQQNYLNNKMQVIRDIKVSRNIFYTKSYNSTSQSIIYATLGNPVVKGGILGSVADNLSAFGDIDSNYANITSNNTYDVEYYYPVWQGNPVNDSVGTYSFITNNKTGWGALSGHDIHTTALANYHADSVPMVTNWSPSVSVKFLGGNYKDAKNVTYNGSITMQPYTGMLLFYVGPVVPGGGVRINRIKAKARRRN